MLSIMIDIFWLNQILLDSLCFFFKEWMELSLMIKSYQNLKPLPARIDMNQTYLYIEFLLIIVGVKC